MAFTKITSADTTNKGVIGLADTPGLSTLAMQQKFDELALNVIIPKHNSLIDELQASSSASNIGSARTTHAAGNNVQTVLNNLDTFAGTAITTANTALNTANSASAAANSAVNTANAASTAANNAVNTANSANATANNARITANTALNTSRRVEQEILETDVYVENTFNTLRGLINDLAYMTDPTTGTINPLQTIINNIYNVIRPAAITAGDYDAKQLTAGAYDILGLTAFDYDFYAYNLLP